MDDGPCDYCKRCGDPIALYDVFDDPICDCNCAPAPKEKEMEQLPDGWEYDQYKPKEKEITCVQVENGASCKMCKKSFTTYIVDALICDECRERGARDRANKKKDELCEVWEKAYFTVLPVLSEKMNSDVAVSASANVADATVAGWPFSRDEAVRKAVQK